jgi:hypothetical protein
MDTNEMIDRYVHEVGEHLPRKMRSDIEMELRSLLLDSLDEQSNGEPTPKITAEVLREFGHPEEIAAQYHPVEFLIGPKLFPTYKIVVTITLIVIGVIHLLGLGFILWQGSGAEFGDKVLSSIYSFGRAVIINAGIVTLIFALIERAAGGSLELPEKQTKTWDPYQLPPVKDPNRIDRGEMVVGIIFAIAFISWLNFFPNWFGSAGFGEEGSGIFVLFTTEFLRLIPLFTISLLLDVVLKTAVVAQGRWNPVTRWLELGVLLFGLYVTYRTFSLEAISIVPFFTMGAKSVLAIMLVVAILEIAFKLFRLLKSSRKVEQLGKMGSTLA